MWWKQLADTEAMVTAFERTYGNTAKSAKLEGVIRDRLVAEKLTTTRSVLKRLEWRSTSVWLAETLPRLSTQEQRGTAPQWLAPIPRIRITTSNADTDTCSTVPSNVSGAGRRILPPLLQVAKNFYMYVCFLVLRSLFTGREETRTQNEDRQLAES